MEFIRNLLGLEPERLVPDVTAGVIGGLLIIVTQLSFGALIFSADLTAFVSHGIGLALFGGVAICAVLALTSSFRGALSSPQDAPAAILAILAASLSLQLGNNPDALYATVVAAIGLTSILSAGLFLLLGNFRLGQLVRYVPFPVIGGFLAGTGWLLAEGGINVMTGARFAPAWILPLLEPAMLIRWIPGLVFAVIVLIILRRFSSPFLMPVLVVAAIGVFYLVLFGGGWSVAQASEHGWLLGPFQQGALWQPLLPDTLKLVRWDLIITDIDEIAAVIIVSVIALLLNVSGIELAIGRDLDLNRELIASGLANLVAGLGGAPAGYHMLGGSVLGYRMGGRSRLIGITAALIVLAVLGFGASFLFYFPRPVLGGLVLFLGLGFLVEWVYDAFFTLSRAEYAIVLGILAVVAAFGFLEGVAAGLVAAILLFVYEYSRIDVVKYALTAETYHSSVERPPSERALLKAHGDEILILELQGFIFFGTGQNLLNRIRTRARDTVQPPLHYVLMDFRRVADLDSSAISSFVRIRQLLDPTQIKIVLTNVSPKILGELEPRGIKEGAMPGLRFFPTLDYGVEWCEDELLAAESIPAAPPDTLELALARVLPASGDRARLLAYGERLALPTGTVVMRQGDLPNGLYLVESGEVSVEVKLANNETMRERTIRPGSVVGEVAMYLSIPRTASVSTIEPSVLYRFDSKALALMEQRDPALAAAFYKWLGGVTAERLTDSLQALEALHQ